MLTRLENILTFKRYGKWKVGEKLESNVHPCFIRIRVITNRVISRFKCIKTFVCPVYILSSLYQMQKKKKKKSKEINNNNNKNNGCIVC